MDKKEISEEEQMWDRLKRTGDLQTDLAESIATVCQQYVFEPNDKMTRSMIEAHISSGLDAMKIYDYKVVCDESNNTSAIINNNELYIDTYVKQYNSAQFIHLPIKISR